VGDSLCAIARYAGSAHCFDLLPGACAPGYMLPPASRARRSDSESSKQHDDVTRTEYIFRAMTMPPDSRILSI
jgi:hypothetical protein